MLQINANNNYLHLSELLVYPNFDAWVLKTKMNLVYIFMVFNFNNEFVRLFV